MIWASTTGGVHLCDVATGKELRRWDDEKKRNISTLACSPDGRLFAAYDLVRGEAGGFARLWDVTTGKEIWQRRGEETRAAFSPDGKVLATGNFRGPIRLWDAATGKELGRCAGQSTVCLAFAPDGKTLASGGGGGAMGGQYLTVRLWDVGSGREVRRADDGHQGAICSVAFTSDGKDMVSCGWEGSLRVWDAATGEQRRRALPAGDEHFHGGSLASIASAVSPTAKPSPRLLGTGSSRSPMSSSACGTGIPVESCVAGPGSLDSFSTRWSFLPTPRPWPVARTVTPPTSRCIFGRRLRARTCARSPGAIRRFPRMASCWLLFPLSRRKRGGHSFFGRWPQPGPTH